MCRTLLVRVPVQCILDVLDLSIHTRVTIPQPIPSAQILPELTFEQMFGIISSQDPICTRPRSLFRRERWPRDASDGANWIWP